jgi:hypothetical protein
MNIERIVKAKLWLKRMSIVRQNFQELLAAKQRNKQ